MIKKLSAMDLFGVEREKNRLIPILIKQGISGEDALAVAGNTAYLSFVLEPAEKDGLKLLHRLSLEDIAQLYQQAVMEGENDFEIG